MALNKLLISGACLRANARELGDGKFYGKAVLQQLDLESGKYTELLSKLSGGKHYPEEYPNLQYTAACLDGSTLWLPTDTEIFSYTLPEFTLTKVFSHPCFHNIHSVHIINKELFVTSTGLDNVVVLSQESGEVIRILNAEGLDPWHRFDPKQDYRLVHSTRPHDCHPNFVFDLDGQPWVTRCKQEDAICLSDPNLSIDLSGDEPISVHDGLFWGDALLFTRVDGYLIYCDRASLKQVRLIDCFSKMRSRPRGWCRGLCVENDIAYIGFSRLRQTRSQSRLDFLRRPGLMFDTNWDNGGVAMFDLKEERVIEFYPAPSDAIDAIYGVLPYSF